MNETPSPESTCARQFSSFGFTEIGSPCSAPPVAAKPGDASRMVASNCLGVLQAMVEPRFRSPLVAVLALRLSNLEQFARENPVLDPEEYQLLLSAISTIDHLTGIQNAFEEIRHGTR